MEIPHSRAAGLPGPLLAWLPITFPMEIPHSRAACVPGPLLTWLPITFPMEIPHSRAACAPGPLLAWLPYSHMAPLLTRMAPLGGSGLFEAGT